MLSRRCLIFYNSYVGIRAGPKHTIIVPADKVISMKPDYRGRDYVRKLLNMNAVLFDIPKKFCNIIRVGLKAPYFLLPVFFLHTESNNYSLPHSLMIFRAGRGFLYLSVREYYSTWGDLTILNTPYKLVLFKTPQCSCQHHIGDPVQMPFQFIVPHTFWRGKLPDDRKSPFATDNFKCVYHGTLWGMNRLRFSLFL